MLARLNRTRTLENNLNKTYENTNIREDVSSLLLAKHLGNPTNT